MDKRDNTSKRNSIDIAELNSYDEGLFKRANYFL